MSARAFAKALIDRVEALRVKGNTSEGQGINDTVDRVLGIIDELIGTIAVSDNRDLGEDSE